MIIHSRCILGSTILEKKWQSGFFKPPDYPIVMRKPWGDPEIEFAVLDYCGISAPAFWEGYGATRDASPEAEVRRIFYLLYEVQKYIVVRRTRGHDPRRADAYRRQSLQLAQALG